MIEETGIHIFGSPKELGCAIYQVLRMKVGENEK